MPRAGQEGDQERAAYQSAQKVVRGGLRFVLAFIVVVVVALGIAAPAYAQETEAPRALDKMSQRDREREMQAQEWQGPSGFWTSPHKSQHGAYRYRMMGIGAVLLVGMGLLTWRLIRRAGAERAARS